MAFAVKFNGMDHRVDINGNTPLLWVPRVVLGGTGTKFGCDQAPRGACTVYIDGMAIRSCVATIDSIGDSEITTIEQVGDTPTGRNIQEEWLALEVVQLERIVMRLNEVSEV